MEKKEIAQASSRFASPNKTLVVNQVELAEKKSMDFFAWQGARRPHGEPCNDEQHR